MTRKNSLLITFFALVILFITLLATIFLPGFIELIQGPIFLVILFSLLPLGGILIFLTLKQKVKGRLKKFLLLTGFSAVGFFVGSVLHNLFYALGVLSKDISWLTSLMEVIHVAFFLLAVIAAPVCFLVGAIGSVVIFLKNKPKTLPE